VDERLQEVGAETFQRYVARLIWSPPAFFAFLNARRAPRHCCRRANNIDKELRNFANASRQLGSSAGVISSTFHLRERLAIVSYLPLQ
jgi:hypothetical protein